MLSPGKLLLIALVVAIVLFGWRWLGMARRNKAVARRRREDGEAIDLVRNPRTGAFEPRRERDG